MHLGKTVSPFESIGKSRAIDRTASDFHNENWKIQKIKRLIKKPEYDKDISRYVPGTLELMFQGMIDKLNTLEQLAHLSYKDKENLDFQILLKQNHYTNLSSFHVCCPIKIKRITNPDADIDDDLITVNNFVAHWIKEINIAKYGSDKQLIPTSSPYDIYQYSDSMLKHLPEKSLQKIEKNFLYSKKMVSYNRNTDRRPHNTDTPRDITDENIDDRIDKFAYVINIERTYRIPWRSFCDLGKISSLVKIDFKIRCSLETDMKKTVWKQTKITAIGASKVENISQKPAPFIEYEQFLLTTNFRQ